MGAEPSKTQQLSIATWLEQERPGRCERCGHWHRLDDSEFDRVTGPDQGQTFRLERAYPRLRFQADHADGEQWISLDAGTLVRCDASIGYADPCSDIYWNAYRCLIQIGLFAGQCVEIPNAGTPGDDWPTNRGSRPRLGMPGERVVPSSVPND